MNNHTQPVEAMPSSPADDLKTRLCQCFLRDNQNFYEDFLQALDNDDIVLAHRMVHSLKSSAGLIEEKSLQETAKQSESMLKEGKNLLTPEQKQTLQTELNIVLKKLSGITEVKSTHTATKSDKDHNELFSKLETLLQNNNPQCIYLLNDLRAINGTEVIVELIEDFEFEKALVELERLKKIK